MGKENIFMEDMSGKTPPRYIVVGQGQALTGNKQDAGVCYICGMQDGSRAVGPTLEADPWHPAESGYHVSRASRWNRGTRRTQSNCHKHTWRLQPVVL